MILRFVHLSDIHFGQEKNGKLIYYDDVRNELLRNCSEMQRQLGPAHGILITGDIAYSGKPEQYHRAGEWLDRLTDAIGCPKTAVITVPGNHDIDLAQISHWGEMAYKQIRGSSPESAGEELAKCCATEEGNPLVPPVKAYREFSERYGCGFESIARPICHKSYRFTDPMTLNFIGLNSVRISNLDDDLNRLILGASQYIIENVDNAVQIVMLHHPLEYFIDRHSAKPYLTRRARVIMTGHEHTPKIQKEKGEDDTEWLMISAGATSPPERFAKYTYNWIEFSLKHNSNSKELCVKVFPKVWSTDRTSFITDTTRFDGECKEFLLACPNIQNAITPQQAPTSSLARQDPLSHIADEGVTVKPQYEDERFARLRYYFWRFLDWRQRLTVLAKIGILPSIPDKALSQTMERVALNEAQLRNKLYELWIAVMELVPADKRESNPFHVNQE